MNEQSIPPPDVETVFSVPVRVAAFRDEEASNGSVEVPLRLPQGWLDQIADLAGRVSDLAEEINDLRWELGDVDSATQRRLAWIRATPGHFAGYATTGEAV